MSSLAIVSANLGNFEKPINFIEQSLPPGIDSITYKVFTDENFAPRLGAMTPRLQARIVKMTSWQMEPGHDYYLWIDGSCRLSREDSTSWFIKQLGDADAAFFEHPHRQTVQDEADYLEERLKKCCPYITPRYKGERMSQQMKLVNPDERLYATTAFIYRDSEKARDMLTVWWLHTSLYHCIDQLSLPAAIQHSRAQINVIRQNYLKCKYLEYVRNKK